MFGKKLVSKCSMGKLLTLMVLLLTCSMGWADSTLTPDQSRALAQIARESRMPSVESVPMVTRANPNHGQNTVIGLPGPQCSGVFLQTNDIYGIDESTSSILFDEGQERISVDVNYLFSDLMMERLVPRLYSMFDSRLRRNLRSYEKAFGETQRDTHRRAYHAYVAAREAIRLGDRETAFFHMRQVNNICIHGRVDSSVGSVSTSSSSTTTDRLVPRDHGVALEVDTSEGEGAPSATGAQ